MGVLLGMRLERAPLAGEREPLDNEADRQAGISLDLGVESLTLRGGKNPLPGGQTAEPASGGIGLLDRKSSASRRQSRQRPRHGPGRLRLEPCSNRRLRDSGQLRYAGNCTRHADNALLQQLPTTGPATSEALAENTSVTTNQLPVHAGMAGGNAITVPNDGFQSLAPGSYGAVLVRSRGILELEGSGVYRFASLLFEPDGFLSIVGDDAEVVVAVDGSVSLGDRSYMDVSEQ